MRVRPDRDEAMVRHPVAVTYDISAVVVSFADVGRVVLDFADVRIDEAAIVCAAMRVDTRRCASMRVDARRVRRPRRLRAAHDSAVGDQYLAPLGSAPARNGGRHRHPLSDWSDATSTN